MKRSKVFSVLMLSLLLFVVTSCVTDTHEHRFGNWTITVDPTEETTGVAERSCNCIKVEKVTVPALTDKAVWTVEVVDATCTEEGSKTYTSEYGKIKVAIEKTEHASVNWSFVTEPTEELAGLVKGECVCGLEEEIEVPALKDETVWTLKETVESTCAKEGKKVYTSMYGDVTVVIPTIEHTYVEWEIVEEPTEENPGVVLGTCECTHKEEFELAALKDETVWQLVSEEKANYNEAGSKTYTSKYGEVTIVVAKLVAPYDNKFYSSFTYDVDDDLGGFANKKASVETAWNMQTVQIGANGSGVGTAHPFRGLIEIKMVDETTGKIEISTIRVIFDSEGNPTYDEDGNLMIDTESAPSVSYGYVDFETGIIVSTFNQAYNKVNVWTPFEVGVNENTNASSWDASIAIDYTYNEVTYSMLVHKDVVYFGVKFVDEKDARIVAEDCYKNSYVYVVDEDNNKLFGFVHNGEKLVIADGLEGTYTSGTNTLVVSGCGTLTLNGVEGTYEVAEGDAYSLGAYVDGEYFEVTLEGETYSLVKPMVTITYDAGDKATVAAESVNKNIAYTLNAPTNAEFTFKGWYYDSACTKAVETPFIPTGDVTLYALWKAKVVINLVGVLEGDANTILLGVGDVIGSALPVYGVEEEIAKVFRGWYLDANFETSLPEEVEVSEEDSGFTIYAKWEDLAPYYGTHKGTELYNAGYGNNANVVLTIDENGNISGKWTGIVTDYDPTTQKISWKSSASSTTVKYFWFEPTLNVLVTSYSGQNTIGNDFYIFGKYQTTNKVAAFYGVKAPIQPGSTNYGWYAHFVNIMTKDGAKEIFLYNEHIYADVTITDTLGNPLTAATVKNSKTVVVTDNTTGEIIVAVASIGTSFSNNSNTNVLDPYFGTYTNGVESITLDGTGAVVMGEKTGTYTKVEGADYDFDVYLEDGAEYYELTLDEKSFTITKPMVTIDFVVGEGHAQIKSIQVNKNTAVTLPSGEEEGYVFNGYFLDQACTTPVPANYKVTSDTTIYAKHSLPAVLTIVYNNGEENLEVTYSVGDIATVERPVREGYAFISWHTNVELTDEAIWESGSAITVDTTIYAKWETAPIYNKTYVVTEIEGDAANGSTSSVYTRTAAKVAIDPYGFAPKSSYPFSSDAEIKNFNKETNYLEIHMGSTIYYGYIDPVSRIIIFNYAKGTSADITEVLFFNPFETTSISSKVSSSYWNGGKSRTIQYTYDGTTYSIFVHNNQVYFNVAFKDSENNDVLGNACYKAETLYVYASDSTLIGKFGFDGTTMRELDGNEGTYTNATDTLFVNGVDKVTLNGVEGTYTLVENASYTADVYLDGSYYELTLDKVAGTYTINKPMVTITFEADGKATVDPVTINKNIEYVLPTLTNDEYTFRGWYLDAELNQEVAMNYLPVETLTLYAKWDKKVTVTVVYGNTLETVVLNYGVGDTAVLEEPEFTNGKVFEGWYLNAELTQSYTPGTVSESITVYCGWKNAIALYGSYAGTEVWGSSKNGSTSSGGTSKYSLAIDAEGNVTGQKSGTITEFDAETGSFKLESNGSYYFGVYDEETGVLAYSYSSNKLTLGTDYYIYVKGAETAVVANRHSSYWNAGLCRLSTFTVNGSEEMNVFTYDDKLYANVTFTSTSSATVNANNAYSQSDLSVFDSEGNLIAEFLKKDGGLVVKALDGYQGTYTVGTDTLVLDGYGKGTLNGTAITYAVSGTLFTVTGAGETKYYEYDSINKVFAVKELDALTNKSFKASMDGAYWGEVHDVTFKFDGMNGVKISFSCSDNYCYPSYTGDATYSISGSTVTVTKVTSYSGTFTFVFTLDNEAAPTKLTCTSTTMSSSQDGYFATGTIFK